MAINHPHLTDQEEIDRDLDLFDMENKWRESLPRHTDYGWLQIFPEAVKQWKPRLLRRMKHELMFLKAHLNDSIYDTRVALMENKYEWRDDLIKEGGRRRIAEIERKMKQCQWQMRLIRELGKKPVDGVLKPALLTTRITPDMIEAAKRFPLEQLVEVNRQGFAKCVWHADQHASMFCKKNFAHCFSCGRNGDTISVLMEKEGMTFKDAVMRLQS